MSVGLVARRRHEEKVFTIAQVGGRDRGQSTSAFSHRRKGVDDGNVGAAMYRGFDHEVVASGLRLEVRHTRADGLNSSYSRDGNESSDQAVFDCGSHVINPFVMCRY